MADPAAWRISPLFARPPATGLAGSSLEPAIKGPFGPAAPPLPLSCGNRRPFRVGQECSRIFGFSLSGSPSFSSYRPENP